MFFVIRELSESKEGVRERRAMPSVVGLVALNDCSMTRRNVLQRALRSEVFWLNGGRRFLLPEREHDVGGLRRFLPAAPEEGELPDEVVQRGSQV
jgi:hypothetical protein